MLLSQEYREIHRSASLRQDGSSSRGRKTKHNTATRRWIDTVGLPDLAAGKLPEAKDLAMLRSGPRVDVPCDEAYLGSRATEAGECPRGCSRNSTAA